MDRDVERLVVGLVAAVSLVMKWQKRRAKAASSQANGSRPVPAKSKSSLSTFPRSLPRLDPIDMAVVRERDRARNEGRWD